MAIAELWECLQQDPPEWHRFFSPASEAQLRALEAELSVKLPRSFRRFLQLTNGALLFGEPILGAGGTEGEQPSLLETLARARAGSPALPEYLIPFAPTDEGVDCFLAKGRLQEGEYPVVFFSYTDGESEATHEAFDEWLFELTEDLRAASLEEQGAADPS